jgi:adenylate cyclase
VVIDGDDIQGDGVNVAARLEAMAEPGAICVSDAVHDQVRDRLDLTFADLGAQQLKNIDRPVQVWQWTNGATAKPLPEDVVLELPDKPSIAVLPFDNMSGDPEQEYFADGIAEDIITALSRSRELFVIARNSSFTYRGKSVDIRMVGKDLGVRFVLEGSVRRAGNRVRITAQLIEAATGNHVWAERDDRPVDDIFEVQDEITINVAGAVGSEIRAADVRSVAGKRVETLQSWERLMKAYWHIFRTNSEDNLRGQEICRAEIAANGGSAAVHSALVFGCFFELIWNLGNRPLVDVIKEGMQAGRAAVEKDSNDAAAHASLSFLLWACGDHDGAIREGKTAFELTPNSTWGHLALGYSGAEYYEDATAHLNFAIRLGPRDIGATWVHTNLSSSSFISEKYSDAIDHAYTALRHDPTNGTAHRLLTASLACDGQIETAKEAWVRAWENQPLDLPGYVVSMHRMFKRDEDADKLIDALRLAGAPFE